MKAIDLVKILCTNPDLIEMGGDTMKMDCFDESTMDAYCEGFFGAKGEWFGHRVKDATYFYLYLNPADCEHYIKVMGGQPDANTFREEAGDMVALWRVE